MSGGEDLARVLLCYGYEIDVNAAVQKIVCPFHDDVNPSMMVNLENGSWFCFGCNMSGDARSFVRLIEGMRDGCNELEALKRYVKMLKSNKAVKIELKANLKRRRRPSRQLYDEAYDYYHGLSKTAWKDSDDPEVSLVCQYMLDRGFTCETLQECGAKLNFSNSYKLIFPMLDNGKFKGWVCRTTLKDVEKKRKYLYNEGFSRATTLVGNYEDEDYVIVVEGYMDRLKLVQLGVKNAVAILGWKMTAEQIMKLKAAGIRHVISALDNDDCGRRGTRWLARHFTVTRWSYLKGVKDPGDFTEETFSRMHARTMRRFRKDAENGIG